MKEEILEYFKDINFAYNDCTRFDTLKRMLGELEQEQRTGHWKILNLGNPSRIYICPECDYYSEYAHNYCPKCGMGLTVPEDVS